MPKPASPRIVIAPDSFKESCSAHEVAAAIAAGVQQAIPTADCIRIPIADGGEGTIDAILEATPGQRQQARVTRADGTLAEAHWALLANGAAVIELASAAGLEQIPVAQRDPLRATTYGVGELVRAALDAGARRIILCLGGSATNDAGAGMLQALGLRLLNAEGKEIGRGGAALAELASIDSTTFDSRVFEVEFEVAADVTNPLCGPQGASAVFGPQKGASLAAVQQLDVALQRFAEICQQTLGQDFSHHPGAGAAGGTGFAALAFLGAQMRPGFELVAELTQLERHIRHADLVFAAEGRFDGQTSAGKAPAGVIRMAHQAGVPVVALCGALGEGYESMYAHGLTAAFSISAGPSSLQEAYAQTATRLTATARDAVRLYFAHRQAAVSQSA